MSLAPDRSITPEERFEGEHATLRLLTLDDCSEEYVGWLRDPDVNRYLETRWTEQTLDSVRAFVTAVAADPASHLFAIVENEGGHHVGNLKIGPINSHHGFADLSYFIGEKSCWGRGYATEAIRLAVDLAFERLGVRRLQAGLYAGNRASARALEKAGFVYETRFKDQLVGPEGLEDHVWYVVFNQEMDLP